MQERSISALELNTAPPFCCQLEFSRHALCGSTRVPAAACPSAFTQEGPPRRGPGICSLAAVGITAVQHLQSQRGGEGSRASLFTELSLTQCKQNAGVTAITCAKVYGLGTSHSRGGDHTRVSTWSGNSTKGKDRGAGGCSQRLWRTGDTHLAEGGRRSSKMPLRGTHFI